MEWKMKRLKFTKTSLEKLPHPIGKRPVRYFATNCSHLCILVQPQPSLVKSYYAHWGKIILKPDGTQKRTGRYKFICRFGVKPLEAVMDEAKDKLKEWKKEKSQSSKAKTVNTLVDEFIKSVSGSYRMKTKGHKVKYKKLTSDNYIKILETYVRLKTKKPALLSMLTDPFKYNGAGYVTGALKDIPLNKISKRDIEIWHARMEPISTTGNRALAILSIAFEWDMKRAVTRLYLGENNPCLRITKYQEGKDKRFLELNKVLEIKNYCINEQWRDPHFLTFYILLLEFGERLRDAYGIMWRKPDLASEQKNCSGWINWETSEIHLTDTKNRKPADVGLTVEAVDLLRNLQKYKIDPDSRAGWAASSPYVFPRVNDPTLPINDSSYRKKLQKFNFKFGLGERIYVRGKGKQKKYRYKNLFTLKHLRKTFVTHYGREHGEEAASHRVRHSSIKVTRDHYFSPEQESLKVKHMYKADSADVIDFKKKEQK
jgi:hypothetical protein